MAKTTSEKAVYIFEKILDSHFNFSMEADKEKVILSISGDKRVLERGFYSPADIISQIYGMIAPATAEIGMF